MNEELVKILVAFVAKTTGKSEEEVSSLLKTKEADQEKVQENALNNLLELDKSRVTAFDKKIKEQDDKGYKRGQAESLGKFETELKEKYGITDSKKGIELVEAIVASKASQSGETDETKIKTSKVYLDTVDKLKKEKEAEVKAWQDKFESREKQLKKETTFKTISEKALTYFDSLNPILPEDTNKAKNLKNLLLSQLGEFEFEVKEDGKIIVLKKEGDSYKVFEDEHGHAVSFENIVKSKADGLFEYKQGQHREGTGTRTQGGDGGKTYTGPVPKNGDEYVALIKKAGDDQKLKEQITEVWKVEQSKQQ